MNPGHGHRLREGRAAVGRTGCQRCLVATDAIGIVPENHAQVAFAETGEARRTKSYQ